MIASNRINRFWILCFEIAVFVIIGALATDALAADVTLAWDPNTESDLAGYKIHHGTAIGSYSVHIDVNKATTYTVTGLTAGQTYYFAATAYDASGNESGYSNSVSYAVPGAAVNGAPTTPATPSGAASALVNTAVTFSTSATDPNGDSLQYQYDWGDGVLSAWGAASQSHSWTAAGQYAVKAQARDSRGSASGWSAAKTVIITQNTQNTQNGAPTTPATPSGAASALVNTAVTFSTSAIDPNGDSLQYQYDWGGGVLSSWGASSQSRSWAAAGQYAVKAKARDSKGAESGWSAAKTVTISQSSTPVVVDSDGDGVPDSRDAFPKDPKEWADANGNHVGDNADAAAAGTSTNQKPSAPTLASPVDDAKVSSAVVLKSGAFRTAVAGTTHAKTRWQVFGDDDDACVLDILSPTALTSLTVPRLVLDEGTTYFWRAQFIDSKGVASAWSDYEYFSTLTTMADRNTNGIPDAQEVLWKTDLDRDGVRDNRQTTIRSVKMAGTSAQVGVSIKGCPTALAIEAVQSASSYQSGSPSPSISFKIAVAKPGDRAAVKLYLSEAAPSGSRWYRYDTVSGKWADFSVYAKFAADRRSVELSLTDGGTGDADGVANGVIVTTGTLFSQ